MQLCVPPAVMARRTASGAGPLVAWKRIESAGKSARVATTSCVSPEPRIQGDDAVPSDPVTTSGSTRPSPARTANRTVTPGTGAPRSSSTLTTSGAATAVPAVPR